MNTRPLLRQMARLEMDGQFSFEEVDGRVVRAWFGDGSGPDGNCVDLLDLAKALHESRTDWRRYRVTIEVV
jgi:hypothetical protein